MQLNGFTCRFGGNVIAESRRCYVLVPYSSCRSLDGFRPFKPQCCPIRLMPVAQSEFQTSPIVVKVAQLGGKPPNLATLTKDSTLTDNFYSVFQAGYFLSTGRCSSLTLETGALVLCPVCGLVNMKRWWFQLVNMCCLLLKVNLRQ